MVLSEDYFLPNWAISIFEHRHRSWWRETVLGVRNCSQKSDVHRSKLATSMLFLSLFYTLPVIMNPFFCGVNPRFLSTEQKVHSFFTPQAFYPSHPSKYLHPSCEGSAQMIKRVKRSNLKFLKREDWPKVRAVMISLKGPVPILFCDRMLNW